MAVRVGDKIKQLNDNDFKLLDSNDIEYNGEYRLKDDLLTTDNTGTAFGSLTEIFDKLASNMSNMKTIKQYSESMIDDLVEVGLYELTTGSELQLGSVGYELPNGSEYLFVMYDVENSKVVQTLIGTDGTIKTRNGEENSWSDWVNISGNVDLSGIDDKFNKLKYYGDPDIEITSQEYFTGNFNDKDMTCSIYPAKETNEETLIEEYVCSDTNIVVPYKITYNNKEYLVTGISTFIDYPLKSIIIPNSVTTIKTGVFNSTMLTSLTIPASVTSIGKNLFYESAGVPNIKVDSNNTQYTLENGVLFNKDKTELLYCPASKTGDYSIPEGVTNIGAGAFFDTCLINITIPDTVTGIENFAFSQCVDLKKVYYKGTKEEWDDITINNDNDYLAMATIYYTKCGDNLYWTLNDDVLEITGSGAMYDYTSSDIAPWFYITGGNKLTTEITSIKLPDGLTHIGTNAFNLVEGLTEIYIPNSVTPIKDFIDPAFNGTTFKCYKDSAGEIYAKEYGFPYEIIDDLSERRYYTKSETEAKIDEDLTDIYTTLEKQKYYGDADIKILNQGFFTAVLNDTNMTCSIAIAKTEFTVSEDNGASTIEIFDEGAIPYKWVTNDKEYLVISIAEEQVSSDCTGTITIPNCVTSLKLGAFSKESLLSECRILNKNTKIEDGAFLENSYANNLVTINSSISIGCYRGSTAETYAKSKYIPRKYIDDYYTTSETDKKISTVTKNVTTLESKVNSLTNLHFIIVNSLPTTSIDSTAIYLLSNGTEASDSNTNYYDEYVYITSSNTDDGVSTSSWEKIGTTEISLDDYYTKEETETYINETCALRTDITEILEQNEKLKYYGNKDIEITTDEHLRASMFNSTNMTCYISGNDKTLTDVVIPYKWTEDGAEYTVKFVSGFKDYSNLTSVVIPNSVTIISSYAFQDCPNLESVIIPNSVTRIDSYAFSYSYIDMSGTRSSKLTSIIIPESVAQIGDKAFYLCENLASVTILNKEVSIGTDAFDDCASNLVIHCYKGSTADQYGENNNITREYIDEYYTAAESDEKYMLKTDVVTVDLTDYYTKSEIDAKIGAVSDTDVATLASAATNW